MVPSRSFFNRLPDLMGADVAHLANPTLPGARIALIDSPFTPSSDLVLADLSIDPAGFDPVALGLATSCEVFDVPGQTARKLRQLPDGRDFGAFTDGFVTPVTIYGLAWVGPATVGLVGVERFTAPLTFTKQGEQEEFFYPRFTFPVGFMQ